MNYIILTITSNYNKNKKVYSIKLDRPSMDKVEGYKYKWGVAMNHGYPTVKCRTTGMILSRYLTSCPPDLVVDHINGDTLDNRISNLRVCTIQENSKNRRVTGNSTSGYKGVWRHKKGWKAGIQVNGAGIHLGCFKDKKEAARTYDEAAKRYFGEFARLNFPNP